MSRPTEPDRPRPARPRRVYGVGSAPDPRFSLANERTALAWMRTALALVAGGVGLTSLTSLAGLPRPLHLLAAAACVSGAVLAGWAVLGWQRAERSLRTGAELPAPTALPWLAAVVALLALLLAGYSLGTAFW